MNNAEFDKLINDTYQSIMEECYSESAINELIEKSKEDGVLNEQQLAVRLSVHGVAASTKIVRAILEALHESNA